ncbi:DUF1919 domain-containing protein [Flavobacterium sp. MC2016-06]|uniref:DUF1919 domain-containing protein n=1 Tax=Flavobacterium sp. MC2016-06 TaxID=2676308 RepID=UPI0018ACAD1D|nr:DUF1919 domain-containing protein [Flavobacterium sp. MC2016-06]MBU3862047.1 DUF1919 domain-containing protein [Flavobacterium sp. MC2016-06]
MKLISRLKLLFISQRDRYYKNLRMKYAGDLKEYLPQSPCIISNNCLGGFIYQDTGYSYLSPTIGLYFFFPDYIEFLSDLENNLKLKIDFVTESKYSVGNERLKSAKHKYPVGLLGGKFEIHFLHYHSEEEAEKKWNRRVERINLANLIVIGTELDLCTKEDIEKFDNLSFKNKFFFTKLEHKLKSTIIVPEFYSNPKIGDPYRNGHVLYKYFVQQLNSQN